MFDREIKFTNKKSKRKLAEFDHTPEFKKEIEASNQDSPF